MCSETQRLGMLIILHNWLFLMPHNSSNMSLSNIETTVLYNQYKEMFCNLSLTKLDF